MQKQFKIPSIPHAFFRWYCRQEKYEELHGDLEEFFYERAEEIGLAKARWHYFLDVLRCCQPYAWKQSQSQSSNIIMFRNYYKTSIRSLMKNPVSSVINLLGLSAAIGICVLAYAFNVYTFKIDQFHENRDEVYLITFFADRDGSIQQNGKTPLPLGRMIENDFAQVEKMCRVKNGRVVVKYEDQVFHERIRYVDPEFLEMLTFPLKWGQPTSLRDPNSVILNEYMSTKYFGDYNPVGENIRIIFGEDNSKIFKVAGVANEFPGARSFGFDFLINFDNLSQAQPHLNMHDWTEFIDGTLVQIDDHSDLSAIEEGTSAYVELQNQVDSDWSISSFQFEQLTTLYERSGDIRGGIASNGFDTLYKSCISFIIIGFFVLVLASTNYINIAIVSVTKRLKEIGLRKVIGASRRMVIVQFMSENMLVMLIALILGIILGVTVFIPWLEQSSQFDMDFTLYDGRLWIFLPAVLIFTGIASGAYPAFYVSRFQASTIFKGSFKIGKRSLLTKVFLGFQLMLACILISIAVMFAQNNTYQFERSWGYDEKQVLYVNVNSAESFEQLFNQLAGNPEVEEISGSAHHLGKSHGVVEVDMPDRKYEVHQLRVDSNYFKTMGLKLLSGRGFRGHHESEKQKVIVNSTLLNEMGLGRAIGEVFKIDSVRYEVIGVVEDFHSYSFYTKVRPLLFMVADEEDYRYLSLKVRPGSIKQAHEKLQVEWASLFPELPFNGGYQEDVWGNYQEDMESGSRFWKALASVVLLLAGLGLYGLVTLNVSGRVREFSIRKVLGAGLKNIASLITRQYLMVFILALVLGGVGGFYLVKTIFGLFYVYHMPLSFNFMVFTGGILGLVLTLVIGLQVNKVASSNPAQGLKVE